MGDDKINRAELVCELAGATASATATVHSPLPNEHPFHHVIGQVCAEWSRFEQALDRVIWDLVELDHAMGACITAQIMGAAPRFQTILALATRKGAERKTIDMIVDAQRNTYDVQEMRNRIIHDTWYIGVGTEQISQFKSMPRSDLHYGIKGIDRRIQRVEAIRSALKL